MDVIYTFDDYKDDVKPRLIYPEATGKNTTYTQWLIYHYRLNYDEPYIEEEPSTVGPAFVNHGRWLWLCPACGTSVQVCSGTQGGTERIFCPACYSQRVVTPQFPDNRAEIEEELLRQPGYRWNAPFRNWEPGWSMDYLRERTASAQAQMEAGVLSPRAASIGIPRTWAVGEVLTASNMNTFVREIQRDLRGDNGAVELVHGMRPGTFTTAQIQALTGIVDGVMLYNSTTERHEYFVGGDRRGFAGVHTSGLFAAGEVVTVSHDLGFAPTSFQLAYERVASSAQHGHDSGDRVYVGEGGLPPGWAVFDVTATSYKVAMVASRLPVFYGIDTGRELVRIDPLLPGRDTGGFGSVGTLPSAAGFLSGATILDGDLWAVRQNANPAQLWRFDLSDISNTSGVYGNQGDLPSAVRRTGTRIRITSDGTDIWLIDDANDLTADYLWRIDPANPGSTSGSYGEIGRIPLVRGSSRGMAWLDGDLWVADATTSAADLLKIDVSDPDRTTGGYGNQGALNAGTRGNDLDITAYDGDIWLVDLSGDIWRINPADPGQTDAGYGNQGDTPSAMGTPAGLAATFGDDVLTAQITAASGDLAGYQAEITVDNDASEGGWGARLLAFA